MTLATGRWRMPRLAPAARRTGLLLGLRSLLAVTAAAAHSPTIAARQQFSVDDMHATIGFVAKIVGFVKVRG